MEIGSIVSESYEYAKESVWEQWGRWALLIVALLVNIFSLFLIPVFFGYLVRILKGTTPAPEVDNWGKLFVDGWKYNIITLVYFIIPVAIAGIIIGIGAIPSIIASGMTGSLDAFGAFFAPAVIIGVFMALIIAFILALIYVIGIVRFAKTESVGEAFNFKAILDHIGSIGWGSYILSLIVLVVVMIIINIVLSLIQAIPIIGFLISLILSPVIGIFESRYFALVYESAPAPA